MVSNSDLIKLFDEAVPLCKGTRIQKLRKSPTKLLYSKILELIALWFTNPARIKVKTFWGDDMFVVLPELVSVTIHRYGLFEEGLTRMILEYLKPGMTFFDIGAHFGYFSLLASKIVDGNGYVHSFEPTPSTFELLRENTQTRGNIYINNMAVFSDSMKIMLNDYGIAYSAFNSLYNSRLNVDSVRKLKLQSYEIQAISIDEYVKSMSVTPHFIKIDAESSELEILKGMVKTIQDFHSIISIEVGDYEIEGIPRSKELVLYLMNHGYEPYEYDINKEQIIKHELRERYEYNNILFIPRL